MAGKPFIPGAVSVPSAPAGIAGKGQRIPFVPGQSSSYVEELPLITQFLAHEVPIAPMVPAEPAIPAAEPVEHLPLITEFLAHAEPDQALTPEPQVVEPQRFEPPQLIQEEIPEPFVAQDGPAEEGAPIQPLHEVAAAIPEPEPQVIAPVAAPAATEIQPIEESWIQEEWQKFDWRSAASLGPNRGASIEAAESAWAEGDWDDGKSPRERPKNQPEALAAALENLAKKVRSGSLKVEHIGTESEEAALAAALAALLAKK